MVLIYRILFAEARSILHSSVMQLTYDKKILDTVLDTFIRNKTLVYGEDRVKQNLVLFPKLINSQYLFLHFYAD